MGERFAQAQAARKLQEPDIVAAIRRKDIDRFFDKVIPEPNSGCWLWLGATGQIGHGQFFMKTAVSKGVFAAHRFSWLSAGNSLGPTDLLCHKCDTPSCVNPNHLFVGTQKDNMRDAANKGRCVMPDTVGAANSQAVLTEKQVIEIRAKWFKSLDYFALRFNVSKTCVCDARQGKTWSHLPGAVPTGERRKSSNGRASHVWRLK